MTFFNPGKWYWGMTLGQRRLCWIVSIVLIPFLGIGIIPSIFLLYFQLGKDRYLNGRYLITEDRCKYDEWD